MARKKTSVVELDGWKHVSATYDNITSKLDELPGTAHNDLRLQAIKYWQDRLKEDKKEIEAGKEPCVS